MACGGCGVSLALAGLLAFLPFVAEARGCEPEGAEGACAALRAASEPVCKARVDCTGTEAAGDAARALFAACARGAAVSADEVAAMIARFPNEITYQCCVGNALATRTDW